MASVEEESVSRFEDGFSLARGLETTVIRRASFFVRFLQLGPDRKRIDSERNTRRAWFGGGA